MIEQEKNMDFGDGQIYKEIVDKDLAKYMWSKQESEW